MTSVTIAALAIVEAMEGMSMTCQSEQHSAAGITLHIPTIFPCTLLPKDK